MTLEEELAKARQTIRDLQITLLMLSTSSCTCLTKTPQHEYHRSSCNYRIIKEALCNPPIILFQNLKPRIWRSKEYWYCEWPDGVDRYGRTNFHIGWGRTAYEAYRDWQYS